jgi:aminocarboxymuconate-semialdehyde decarboxylase
MKIDAHTHVQPPEYMKALMQSGRYEIERGADDRLIVKEKGSRFLTVSPEPFQLSERIEAMDASGVDMQILSLSTPQVYFLEGQEAIDLAKMCNDYLASIVQEFPQRFRALASIPLTAGIDAAINELVRCMDTLGMPGFIIGGNIDGTPIDDPRFDPFYEEANRRGAVMFIHPMVPPGIEAMSQYALAPLVGFMFDTTLAVSRLIFSDFFGRFLGVNVLVAHLGGAIPYLTGRLDLGYLRYPECQQISRPPSEMIERLYLDTVAFNEPALRMAIDVVGADHVLFGSDYPNLAGDIPAAMSAVEHVAARRDRSKVLGDNAQTLFRVSS